MSQSFSSDETERYARHLVLPEIGGAGQQKLKAAKVIVIGAGGLGAPALQYLAAAGVGHLTIVDNDAVSLSNLQRQVIHNSDAVGLPKVESAGDAVSRINPHVDLHLRLAQVFRVRDVCAIIDRPPLAAFLQRVDIIKINLVDMVHRPQQRAEKTRARRGEGPIRQGADGPV